MIKRYAFILIVFLLSLNVSAQHIDYARYVVDTLASKSFKGRGYVDNGDKKAANFIAKEFELLGLQPFSKNYFQEFTTSVNTFPSEMHLEINGETLIPGKDYLVDPGSRSIKGKFETVTLTISDISDQESLKQLLKKASGKFIVIPPFDNKSYDKTLLKQLNVATDFLKYHVLNSSAGLIVLTKEKLTWSGSTKANAKPVFTVLANDSTSIISNVNVNLKHQYFQRYRTQNVIGHIEGKNKDSLVVVTAHYDHLGMMGAKAMFPGANDNASGVAMLLSLAKHYAKNKPEYTMVFIAFGAEEIGLIGSQYFVEHPLFELNRIKFLLNFDISGTGDDGIQVVNGKLYKNKFNKLVNLNNEQQLLKQVKIRGEACNSDHCLFHLSNVPCFYMYTLGGIKAYHDIYDKAETLPLTEFEDYFKLIQQFIDTL